MSHTYIIGGTWNRNFYYLCPTPRSLIASSLVIDMPREPTVYRQPLAPEDEIELAPPPAPDGSADTTIYHMEKDYRDFIIPEGKAILL